MKEMASLRMPWTCTFRGRSARVGLGRQGGGSEGKGQDRRYGSPPWSCDRVVRQDLIHSMAVEGGET